MHADDPKRKRSESPAGGDSRRTAEVHALGGPHESRVAVVAGVLQRRNRILSVTQNQRQIVDCS